MISKTRGVVGLALGGLVVGALAAPSAHATNTSRFALPLKVVDSQIQDAAGHEVVLNGLHRNGSDDKKPWFPTDDEIAWMTTGHAVTSQSSGSWKANVVRVGVDSVDWTGTCTVLTKDPTHRGGGAAYRAQIDAEIQSITSRGALALLDLHSVGADCSSIDRHPMPDAQARAFWDAAAHQYASNPLVAFELYNEPHWVNESVWRNGGVIQECSADPSTSLTDGKPVVGEDPIRKNEKKAIYTACTAVLPKYQAIGMQELYNVVAAAAPDHLIVVDGLDYASKPPTAPLTTVGNTGIIYAAHPYTCSDPVNQHCADNAHAVAAAGVLEAWRTSAVAGAPILLSEMGWPSHPTGDATYVDGAGFYSDTITWLQDHHVKWGIIGFAFDGSDHDMYDLIESTSTYEPNSTAVPLVALLRANP